MPKLLFVRALVVEPRLERPSVHDSIKDPRRERRVSYDLYQRTTVSHLPYASSKIKGIRDGVHLRLGDGQVGIVRIERIAYTRASSRVASGLRAHVNSRRNHISYTRSDPSVSTPTTFSSKIKLLKVTPRAYVLEQESNSISSKELLSLDISLNSKDEYVGGVCVGLTTRGAVGEQVWVWVSCWSRREPDRVFLTLLWRLGFVNCQFVGRCTWG